MAKKVAIFGATGYVGLILVNRLINLNWDMKLFARNTRRLLYLEEHSNIETCNTELSYENISKLAYDLQGCECIYYLIHSMSDAASSFETLDCNLAEIVALSAKIAGVKQIIYLGGLGYEASGHPLSVHLSSRHEIASILASSSAALTEIRAGIIIGAGSASFEIIKSLGARLPFIPKLSYVNGFCQPIDIDSVIAYLIAVHLNEHYFNKIIEIGSSKILSYPQMVQLYAKTILQRDLKIVNIPLLEKIISKKNLAHIIAFLSAIPYTLAKPLIEGVNSKAIINPLISDKRAFLELPTLSYEEAVKKASMYETQGLVESFWSIPWQEQVLSPDKEKFLYIDSKIPNKDLLQERRVKLINATDADKIFKECLKIGGKHGYWSPKWMWAIRAFLDKLIGGTGLESGRQTKEKKIRVGERIDFWIVSDYLDTPEFKVFTLKARLKSPGSSWLQFALQKSNENEWKFHLRAYFRPKGIKGYLYWYSLWIVHKYIFSAMINNIIKEALKSG
ncbi:MAG: SDR family oxidoreductase [Sulfurimonas sp.]|jgi:uncharacterized protein YbjT (DUF2867 family)|nr:SDR family oxidoreductase [Sulfurimonas sp.]MBU3939827.1 SDR family oxidoreductase [bacterium]MBU4025060.1 SDR family oxidoreductase [bacterium]MBU4059713.1 SDR family oxidoreductase [bacterium]MBU4109688.1 SDR family oxidoreductase [bacterium]